MKTWLKTWLLLTIGFGVSPFCFSRATQPRFTYVSRLEAIPSDGSHFAVLVSVNKYKDTESGDREKTTALLGPANDMDGLGAVLVDRFGFQPENILRLKDETATRIGICIALDALVKRAGPDKQLVFAFAGHGSFTNSLGGEEGNGLDETICPYDRDLDGVGDISDNVLHRYFSAILEKGAWLTVILDSCHSGNASKSDATRSRTVSQRPDFHPVAGPKLDFGMSENRLIFLAATDENDVAEEIMLPGGPSKGKWHGLFTYTLIEALTSSPPDYTWSELKEVVATEISALEKTQKPVFRLGSRVRPFGEVVRSSRTLYRVQKIEAQGKRITIDQGQMAGVAPGSILGVFDPTNLDETLIRYQVTQSHAAHSQAELIFGAAFSTDVQVGWPVAHISNGLFHKPFPIFLSPNLPQTIRAALDQMIRQTPELARSEEKPADHEAVVIGLTENNQIRAKGHSWSPKTYPLTVSADTVGDDLFGWFYQQRLKALRNPYTQNDAPPVELILERGFADPEVGIFDPYPSLREDDEPGIRWVKENDWLRLGYKNISDESIFVTVFYLARDGKIIGWNKNQYDARLAPGQGVDVDIVIELTPPFRQSHVKLIINTQKPFDPHPFLRGRKDDKDKPHDPGDHGNWWTIDLELRSAS